MNSRILLRHLAAIVILPVTVLVIVPVWIARGSNVRIASAASFPGRHLQRPRPTPLSKTPRDL